MSLDRPFLIPPDPAGAGRPRVLRPPDGGRAIARLASMIDSDPRGPTAVAVDAGLDRRTLQRIRAGESALVGTAAAILAALGKGWRDLDD